MEIKFDLLTLDSTIVVGLIVMTSSIRTFHGGKTKC